jgi:hypothetical protein
MQLTKQWPNKLERFTFEGFSNYSILSLAYYADASTTKRKKLYNVGTWSASAGCRGQSISFPTWNFL